MDAATRMMKIAIAPILLGICLRLFLIHGKEPNTILKMSKTHSLPPSMTGKPVCSLIEPGKCQLTPDWQSLKLLERVEVSPTSSVLKFETPDTAKALDLSTCACLLVGANIPTVESGEPPLVVRPYTPISTNAMIGSFDLLIKDYGPNSQMSNYLCKTLKVGEPVQFKHIEFNVKIQAPFVEPTTIVMLVGGTGVTPMVQALHAILGDEKSKSQKVVMLYGSKTSDDILGKELLDQWAKDYPEQLEVHHILSHEAEGSTWTGMRGFIDKERMEKYAPAASVGTDVKIFVCGPPPMYNALCGPRNEPAEIKGLLADLGYSADQVYKF